MKKTTRARKAAKILPDSFLPLKLREQRGRARRALRRLELELALLEQLEDELLERWRIFCTRPTTTRKET